MIRNILHTMLSQGSAALTSLAVLVLCARYLGSEILGKVGMLFLGMAIIRSVTGIFTGSETIHHLVGRSLRRIYFAGLVWILFCTGSIGIIIVYVTGLWEPAGGISLLNGASGVFFADSDLRLALFILSFLSILHQFNLVLLLAREKLRIYNNLSILQPAIIALLLAVQIFVLESRGFGVLLVALYASWFITATVSTFWTAKLLRSDFQERGAGFLSIIKSGLMNEAAKLSQLLVSRYSFFMFASFSMVGVYAGATSFVEKAWILGGSLPPVIMARASGNNSGTGNISLTLALAKVSFALSLLTALVIYLIPAGFYTALLGSDFSEIRALMLYLSPGAICLSFSGILSHYYYGIDKQKVQLTANLAALGVTLLMCFPMVNRYGMYGAAITASFSYIIQCTVMSILFWKMNDVRPAEIFRLRLKVS